MFTLSDPAYVAGLSALTTAFALAAGFLLLPRARAAYMRVVVWLRGSRKALMADLEAAEARVGVLERDVRGLFAGLETRVAAVEGVINVSIPGAAATLAAAAK